MPGNGEHELEGLVFALARDENHRFSKSPVDCITLMRGLGVEGDAHAGACVRHKYLARMRPQLPNLRQVHLLPCELFESLRAIGLALQPGELGENVATSGLTLEELPAGAILKIGPEASIELTGLRTPCALIDRFQSGLKRQMIRSDPGRPRFRCGVMAVVREGGRVRVGDPIIARLPPRPWSALPAL
jgi:hypothetical protein